jgi:hypothetical protein
MKKITILLIVFAFALKACAQQEFDKPVTFNAGFRFSLTGPIITSLPGSGTNDFNLLINKPAFYPVDLAPLDLRYKPMSFTPTYAALPDKPPTMDLNTAIPSLNYLALPQKTTAEINALVIPVGIIAMVWDKTLGVLKIWNGTIWKIYIANQ